MKTKNQSQVRCLLRNGEGLFWIWRFINLSLTYLLRHLPTYLQPRTHTERKLQEIFCSCYQWPWLGPLTTSFRFCGWHHVFTYRISSNTSRALNTSRASNISRGRGLRTDQVWRVCTVCASLVCVIARYEAISRQSKPITNLLTCLLFLWNTHNVIISSS